MADSSRLLNNLAASGLSFHIPSPSDTSYVLDVATSSYDIDEVLIYTESGTITAGFYIKSDGEGGHGTSVTGLDPISVSSTKTTSTPTANNSVVEDDEVILSLPAAGSSPVDLKGHMKVTRS